MNISKTALAELKRNHSILEKARKVDAVEIEQLKNDLTDTRNDLNDARARIVTLESK